jgi:hypothetical protein
MNDLDYFPAEAEDIKKFREKIFAHPVFNPPNRARKDYKLKNLLESILRATEKTREPVDRTELKKEIYRRNTANSLLQGGLREIRNKILAYYADESDKGGARDKARLWIHATGKGYLIIDQRQTSSEPVAEVESATIKEAWKQGRLYSLMQEVPDNKEVRIMDTLLLDERSMCDEIKNLLRRGVNVNIVLMDHTNTALVNARFALREKKFQPSKAIKKIEGDIADLLEIPIEEKFPGILSVRQSSLMPFGSFFQGGEKILLGLFPPLSGHNKGPMIEVSVNSDLGKFLEKNWLHGYWKYGIWRCGIKEKLRNVLPQTRKSPSKGRK